MGTNPIWVRENHDTAEAASLAIRNTGTTSVTARPTCFYQSHQDGEALKKATLILSALAALWIASTPVAFAIGTEMVSPAQAGDIPTKQRDEGDE